MRNPRLDPGFNPGCRRSSASQAYQRAVVHPVVLMCAMLAELYTYLLFLLISTSIMLMQDHEKRSNITNVIAYARKLHYFVANCEHLYGPKFVVYGVHITDDVSVVYPEICKRGCVIPLFSRFSVQLS